MKLTHGGSRAQTYRTYQALKKKSTSQNEVWIKFTWRRRPIRRLEYRVCEFRSLVNNRLVLIAQAHTHTHTKILVSV